MMNSAFGRITSFFAFSIASCIAFIPLSAKNLEYLPGIDWPEPPVVTPGATSSDPPSDAIVLFDGKDLSAWEGAESWKVEDGVAIAGPNMIHTKQKFGDCQLHIEWSAPSPAKGQGQDRGNSGVFFMDVYELQVLDSYQAKTYFDGQAGAIYKQSPPMVNAMRPPGEWNTYDIIWTAPRFNSDGTLASPAYLTALQNGVLIQNHYELAGGTYWNEPPNYKMHPDKLPISLQYHGHPVRYRNIWVRDFKQIKGIQAREPMFHDHDSDKKWKASEGTDPPS
ncbi:3-keto-disaccharide hydrolase [Bythopirellula polymerisocia]|uniref:3-keto-alpha-glucoside-1,2-lyase/3-keto-2-hydroxy-glucal hydratase domain-containing protein n=1 Tax=Bythopirellula polymerisocia TaxID=2528003 RepID=A0A5C6D3C4_9BACT|nr:DUF1080 domain-containing protein [Bythopirellula polymerisocia]TWU29726.1 hypothetical protein Pla144_05050 [Bythopirellula polymerisocia]